MVTLPGSDSGAKARALRVSPLSPAGRGAAEVDRVGVAVAALGVVGDGFEVASGVGVADLGEGVDAVLALVA